MRISLYGLDALNKGMSDFPKAGFTRLLKFFETNTDEIVRLTRAFGLATKVHRGQLFNKTEQYINHPVRVALILVEELQMRDVELACAALLHDASSGIKDEELKEYGERIYSIVRAAEVQATTEEQFTAVSKAPKDVKYIKLAERLDSARSMKSQMLRDKMMRFKDETQKYVVPIATATDDRLAFKLSVALYELK
jgi:guanosine-3',5'-bis(diphosphate) 3'-pyrophosphohydrolase